MVNVNYANAYVEVLSVINNLVKEDYKKIPLVYIEYFEINSNKDYIFNYDTSKSFEEQILLDETKHILFYLFEKFAASSVQKEKIHSYKNYYYNLLEREKVQKYNPDNLFKTDKEEKKEENLSVQETALVEYKKESIFKRIKGFFSKLFKLDK